MQTNHIILTSGDGMVGTPQLKNTSFYKAMTPSDVAMAACTPITQSKKKRKASGTDDLPPTSEWKVQPTMPAQILPDTQQMYAHQQRVL